MYLYSGKTDIGYNRTYNEDYLYIKNLDKTEKNEDYLAMVLDGNGTNMGRNDNADMKVIPSTMLGHEISSILSEIYENNREMLYSYPVDCLKMAVSCANKVLGGFKMGSEEDYGGFSSTITMYFLHNDTIHYLHAGNSRLYLLRVLPDNTTKFVQLTKDQTKAQGLVDAGLIQPADYYINPDRLVLNSGLGIFANPEFQTGSIPLRTNDILLTTTDGIHYALSQKDLENIIYNNKTLDEAVEQMITDAINFKNIDNMTALMLYKKA